MADKGRILSHDPASQMENPCLIGTIIGRTEAGRTKMKTLSALGMERLVWVSQNDIISSKDYGDDITKLEIKRGAEVIIETLTPIQVGDPSTPSRLCSVLIPLNPGTTQAGKAKCGATTYYRPPTVEMSDGEEGSGGGGSTTGRCGNCDWVYVTHCTSCTDRNSSQQCARPFIPYP